MSNILDKIINLLKWPMAIIAVWTLPSFFQSLDYFSFRNLKFIALFGGFIMFFVSRSMMDSGVKTSMQIIAHELTHSFFALLTLHKIKHIRINDDNSGGSMGFMGEGNWLIIITPYFFPLFCVCYMLAIGFYMKAASLTWVFSTVLGYFIGYHMDTVSSQIHDKQTDLQKVGYGFCLTFLPGANLWMIGSMLAFNSNGWESFRLYQQLIFKLNLNNLNYVLNLI